MNMARLFATFRTDLVFLLTWLLAGLGAYVLLLSGVALGTALVVAAGLTVVFVLPFVLGALAVALLVSVLLRPFSPVVRAWLDGRPFHAVLTRVPRAVGQGLVGLASWWLLACRAAARRERARASAYGSADIPISYRPLPDRGVARLRVLMADPATWRDLLFLVAAPICAVASWLVVIGALGGAAALFATSEAVADFVGWADPRPLLLVAAGVGVLVVWPFVVHVLTCGAARLASALLSSGESARMRAELDEQRLRRQLAVDAAEHERRRIERDLHDGAQQRLVALGISLGLARQALPADPVAGAALVEEAHAEAKLALVELRDLARGIHPAILGDRGLDAALSSLVQRSPIPVSIVVVVPRRCPPSVESAAYFVVSESLTNAIRHANANRATIEIRQDDAWLDIVVSDDGVGGADPAAGTGLHGLRERVGALNGRFDCDSPSGGPTVVRASIPCG